LFGQGFLRWLFTDQHEIWHEASPISQAGLLNFVLGGDIPMGREIVALNITPGRLLGGILMNMCFVNALV